MKSASTERRAASVIHIVEGEEAILALQPLLIRFSEQCGQPGILQDLPYFLQKPGFLKRVPYLYLVARRSVASPAELRLEDLLGSLLLLEYRVFGLRTHCFATNDRSGRGSLLAAPQDRLRVAAAACEVLLARRAQIVMISFAADDSATAGVNPREPLFRRLKRKRTPTLWAMRARSAPAYLELQPTLDATMATLGNKTRSNMRYYRRRAEKDLGSTFVPQVGASAGEIADFNNLCMYPVDRAKVLWRLQVLGSLSEPFLIGMKDGEGRWLSILAGRRFGQTSEILWQMNRAGFASQSLGTVMRSYCMEWEIARGARRLQVEGGTFHSMANSFQRETVVDLVVVRSRARRILRRLVQHFIASDNMLAEMLKSDDLTWHEAGAPAHGASKSDEFDRTRIAAEG